jgi:hypothetical protein
VIVAVTVELETDLGRGERLPWVNGSQANRIVVASGNDVTVYVDLIGNRYRRNGEYYRKHNSEELVMDPQHSSHI